MLPKDPNILISYLNTKLRDEYESLSELCSANDYDISEIKQIMLDANYQYSESKNKFIIME